MNSHERELRERDARDGAGVGGTKIIAEWRASRDLSVDECIAIHVAMVAAARAHFDALAPSEAQGGRA